MPFGHSWALEIERAILKYKLDTKETAQKSDRKIKPIMLPDKPEENWAYKGRKLNPIYLSGQY